LSEDDLKILQMLELETISGLISLRLQRDFLIEHARDTIADCILCLRNFHTLKATNLAREIYLGDDDQLLYEFLIELKEFANDDDG